MPPPPPPHIPYQPPNKRRRFIPPDSSFNPFNSPQTNSSRPRPHPDNIISTNARPISAVSLALPPGFASPIIGSGSGIRNDTGNERECSTPPGPKGRDELMEVDADGNERDDDGGDDLEDVQDTHKNARAGPGPGPSTSAHHLNNHIINNINSFTHTPQFKSKPKPLMKAPLFGIHGMSPFPINPNTHPDSGSNSATKSRSKGIQSHQRQHHHHLSSLATPTKTSDSDFNATSITTGVSNPSHHHTPNPNPNTNPKPVFSSLSSVSPFPMPIPFDPSSFGGGKYSASAAVVRKSMDGTPLKALSTLGPRVGVGVGVGVGSGVGVGNSSPFISGPGDTGNGPDSTPSSKRKPLQSLMELIKPGSLMGRTREEGEKEGEDEDEEGDGDIEMEDGNGNGNGNEVVDLDSNGNVLESPSKPGPMNRSGDPSLASRLKSLISRQEASLSLFQSNLRLSLSSTTSISTSAFSSCSSRVKAKLNQLPTTPTSNTTIPLSLLDSADMLLEVIQALGPVQHGSPLFLAKVVRSEGDEFEVGSSEKRTRIGKDENPFLDRPVSSTINGSSPPERPSVLISFLPHSLSGSGSGSGSTTTMTIPYSSRPLGIDPRVLADGMLQRQSVAALELASATDKDHRHSSQKLHGGGGDSMLKEKKKVMIGIWKPFGVVELQERDKESNGTGGTEMDDEVTMGRREKRKVVMCSRYVITENA